MPPTQTRGVARSRTYAVERDFPHERFGDDDTDARRVPLARPRTRGDCADGPRPCPWVSCVWHLYLDVNPATGSLKLNMPHLEVHQLPETCTLDLAEEGGLTLDEVGEVMNLTREAVRLVEVSALIQLRRSVGG